MQNSIHADDTAKEMLGYRYLVAGDKITKGDEFRTLLAPTKWTKAEQTIGVQIWRTTDYGFRRKTPTNH